MAVSMARSEYRRCPPPPAAPAGRPGSDRFRGQPQCHIATSNEGPDCRSASSQRGTSSYTWDEPSTASLQCDSCGDEKGGPNRPTRRRSFMQQRPAPSPRVPRSRAASYPWPVREPRRTDGRCPAPPPPGHAPVPGGRAPLTRCCVGRGGGVMRCAGWPGASGRGAPAPAAPDRRRVGRRPRAVPARE